jgi:hypothetical protein
MDFYAWSTNVYPVYQAKTTDPRVAILANPANAWGEVNGYGPCSSAAGAMPSGNALSVENCLRSESSATSPFYALGAIGMNYYSSSGASNQQPPSIPYRHQFNASPGPQIIYAPTNAIRGYPDSDGVLTIVQPDGTIVELYAATKLTSTAGVTGNGGDYSVGAWSIFNGATEMGDGYTNGIRASLMPIIAGMVTQADVNAGRISHALTVLMNDADAEPGTQAYPAYAHDNPNSNQSGYAGTHPIGSHFILSASAYSGHVWQSAMGQIVAQALVQYGMFTSDSGGAGYGLVIDPGIQSPTWFANGHSASGAPTGADIDLSYIFSNLLYVTTPADRGGSEH